jgi:CDP-paratose 2-epimerase
MSALVTGGAGFIGANLADFLLGRGERVRIFDALSRAGVERNLAWLRARHGELLEFVRGDVRDARAVSAAARGADIIFHLAAQVAVTTSLGAPREDFDVNAGGTLNVLEAARAQKAPPAIVFTSTNKVYGALDDVPLRAGATRYEPADPPLCGAGLSEGRPLSFHSPYGCSKGAADQYVLDYARTFGLRAVVFRMSCIYGPRQLGNEDQGWVAHLLMRALAGEPISIFGDGRQVRDVLFVSDLVDAFDRARRAIARVAGRAFNVGGGPRCALSLLELVDEIERLTRTRPALSFEPWRLADQRWYVSDTRALEHALGWRAGVAPREGVARLYQWLVDERARASAPRDGAVERAGGLA